MFPLKQGHPLFDLPPSSGQPTLTFIEQYLPIIFGPVRG